MTIPTSEVQTKTVKLHVPLSVAAQSLFSLFEVAASNNGFKVIECDDDQATAVLKQESPFSIQTFLHRCIA